MTPRFFQAPSAQLRMHFLTHSMPVPLAFALPQLCQRISPKGFPGTLRTAEDEPHVHAEQDRTGANPKRTGAVGLRSPGCAG